MNPNTPQELDRLRRVSDFDLDYSDAGEALRGLTTLAARIAGTPISLINLIDAFTQWSVANYGMPTEQMPREDSVCQYTILAKESFEVKDLSSDERFRDKPYVTDDPHVRYYFGVPLQTHDGYNIGALCVLDRVGKEIPPEKVEMLKILAQEIVDKLAAIQKVQRLTIAVKEARDSQRKAAHDIRGPLGGIISLSQIIASQGEQNKISDVITFVNMIEKTGTSLLELADEILTVPKTNRILDDVHYEPFNLSVLKERLEKLYILQATPKHIAFDVQIVNGHETTPLTKNKLLQISGNLISNAIKFTPQGGIVHAELELVNGADGRRLFIRVKDTGTGMDEHSIRLVNEGKAISHSGTAGEAGFGLGLALVKNLVDELRGTMTIVSQQGKGTLFEVVIPQ